MLHLLLLLYALSLPLSWLLLLSTLSLPLLWLPLLLLLSALSLLLLLLLPLSSPRLLQWLLKFVLLSPPLPPPSSTPRTRRRTTPSGTATLTVPGRSQEMLSLESPDLILMDSGPTTMLPMDWDSVTSKLHPLNLIPDSHTHQNTSCCYLLNIVSLFHYDQYQNK